MHNRFRESPANRRKPDKDGSVDLANHVGKSYLTIGGPKPSGHTVLRLGVDSLFRGKVCSPRMQQAVFVNDSKVAPRRLFGEPCALQCRMQLISNADAG